MPTKKKAVEKAAPEAEKAQPAAPAKQASCAILFELEYLAAPGRQVLFDAVKKALKEKGKKLTAAAFAKCAHAPQPALFLPDLAAALGLAKFSSSEAAEQALKLFLDALPSAGALPAGLAALIKEARKEGVDVAALSALPEETAAALMQKSGLAALGVKLLAIKNTEKHFPKVDAWMRLAKICGIAPRKCVAIASSSLACRSALAACMRCVVLPDAFTLFQDFGGAQEVYDSAADIKAADFVRTMFPIK